MGYLDALTPNTFRTDAEGRLVLVPFRRRHGYIVPPERAAAFTLAQRRFWPTMVLLFTVSALAFRSPGVVVLVALIGIGAYTGGLWLFTRSLEIAPEVPAVSRREAATRVTCAMGSRTTGAVAMAAILLAVSGGWLLAKGCAPGSCGASLRISCSLPYSTLGSG